MADGRSLLFFELSLVLGSFLLWSVRQGSVWAETASQTASVKMVCTGIDIVAYRWSVGSFVSALRTVRLRRVGPGIPERCSASFLRLFVLSFLLLRARSLPLHGDVELNPGPLPAPTSKEATAQANHDLLSGPAPGRRVLESSTLSVLFGNARSIFPKIEELRQRVQSCPPDVVAITESWLRTADSDSSLSLPGRHI